MKFDWTDVGEIALELWDGHPELDPLEVSLDDLADLVMELDGFDDERQRPDDQQLFAIQQAWLEEVEGSAARGSEPPEADDPAVSYPVS
jgi:FeS assembly protein IscX